MTQYQDWERIAARIRGLNRATTALWEGMECHGSGDYYGLTNQWLIPSAKTLIAELEKFCTSHQAHLSEEALDSLNNGLARLRSLADPGSSGGIPQTTALIAGLLALESELSFHIEDFDSHARPVVERAFLHLQRSLVADADLRRRWLEAFDNGGETACEKLGAIHLLLHGIYTFKTSAEGERTDLVLGEKLTVDTSLQRATTALVLTEWKLVRSAAEVSTKLQQAEDQAARYSAGILAGFELERFRYLVLVSKDSLPLPADRMINGVMYRHINIAVSPSTPSKVRSTSS